MYYNSSQNSNEYYSSYKQELSAIKPVTRDKNSLSFSIKASMAILLLGALSFGATYLLNYFSQDKQEETTLSPLNTVTKKSSTPPKSIKSEEIPKIIITQDELPKSIQIQNAESKIISNIKHNATDTLLNDLPNKSKEHNEIKKQVIALPETSNMSVDDIESIVNIILARKKEQAQSSLEQELLAAETKESPVQTLKESNHYNKVVLSAKDESSESTLTKINGDLEKLNQLKLSNYEKALKPEIATRSNAMRIIVVKEGDSLSKLAQKAYGDKFAYDKIFKANPEIIKNPDQIFVGQKIRIPL